MEKKNLHHLNSTKQQRDSIRAWVASIFELLATEVTSEKLNWLISGDSPRLQAWLLRA